MVSKEKKMWIQMIFSIVIMALRLQGLQQVEGLQQEGLQQQELTCFSSTHPAAQGLKKVFDFNNDEENLWENKAAYLPPCTSSSSSSSSSECAPCIDRSLSPEVVYLFCHHLKGAEPLKMEDSEGPVPFNKTDCPTLPGPAGSLPAALPEEQPGHLRPAEGMKTILQRVLFGLITVVFVVFIILICVFIRAFIKKQRSSSNQNQNHRSERGPAENGTISTSLLHIERETETVNGHCETETVNGHCETETANGHCETETVNGHCETERANGH